MEEKKGRSWQLFRFSLYGFLKNQQYFEPFLILALREKGLSFTQIGILVGFRAISVNLLEIPSGAAADVWGRRRSMMVSMLAYIASFATFALASQTAYLFLAMFAFACGEAFRTGTHKAMIFDWLTHHGRQSEKTKIYGYTRSWSKIGSALNVIVAAGIVICTDSFVWIFWVSIIPFIMNLFNFVLYPAFLDGTDGKEMNLRGVFTTLFSAFKQCISRRALRRLIIENICFEGFHSTAKDYLQPLLKMAAVSLPILLWVEDKPRTAILVAVVYAALSLLGSFASRKSQWAVDMVGSERALIGVILLASALFYGLALGGIQFEISAMPIIGFIGLAVLLNFWKPAFVSNFYDHADPETAATTLSISNQSKTLSIVVLAPGLGWLVDYYRGVSADPIHSLFPVAVGGIAFSIAGLVIHLLGKAKEKKQETPVDVPGKSP